MPTYTDKEIITALEQCKGMVYVAAARLGCDPKTIKKRIADVPDVAEAKAGARELTKDVAELKLFQAIQRGEQWAIQFYLRMCAKERGYSERTDINVSGSLAIPFMSRRGDLELPDDADRKGEAGEQ